MAITLDGNLGILSPDFEPSGSTTPTNGLFLPTTNALGFATNSTERLRLDASGNLGLGVTPSAWATYKALQIGAAGFMGTSSDLNASANAYYNAGWKYYGTGLATLYNQSAGVHSWYNAVSGTAGNAISLTQAMTLDASGRLGVGITNLSNDAALSVQTKTNAFDLIAKASDGYSSNIRFIDSGNTTVYAEVKVPAVNTLAFNTAGTERARINSSGNLLVGTTSAPSYGKMNVVGGFQMTGSSTGTAISSNNGSAAVAYLSLGASYNVAGVYDVALGIDNIATTAGKRIIIQNRTQGVYVADGGTSWTSNSDERLKTDLKPIENAAQKVSSLRAVRGRYKTDDEGVSRSFLIAQDVLAVLPEAVDASDPDKLGVQYTDTIPLLVAAIKELTARLEALEAK